MAFLQRFIYIQHLFTLGHRYPETSRSIERDVLGGSSGIGDSGGLSVCCGMDGCGIYLDHTLWGHLSPVINFVRYIKR